MSETKQTHDPPGELARAVQVFTDGCAKGNPGQAGAGYVIQDLEGEVLVEGTASLGETTNNVAEYRALILAMERCVEGGVKSGYFFTDSELMARQVNGVYRIKNESLALLASKVFQLRDRFENFEIHHVRRNKNVRADQLANEALKLDQQDS